MCMHDPSPPSDIHVTTWGPTISTAQRADAGDQPGPTACSISDTPNECGAHTAPPHHRFPEHARLKWRAPEQGQIRAALPGLMLSTPPLARAQLSEALSVISGHDFPARWPELLPELIRRLGSGTPAEVAGVLETANSIYKRYRGAFMSDALSRELAYSQQLVRAAAGLPEGAGPAGARSNSRCRAASQQCSQCRPGWFSV